MGFEGLVPRASSLGTVWSCTSSVRRTLHTHLSGPHLASKSRQWPMRGAHGCDVKGAGTQGFLDLGCHLSITELSIGGSTAFNVLHGRRAREAVKTLSTLRKHLKVSPAVPLKYHTNLSVIKKHCGTISFAAKHLDNIIAQTLKVSM